MTPSYFRQYIAGYTVINFRGHPIRRRVTNASALEFFVYMYEQKDEHTNKKAKNYTNASSSFHENSATNLPYFKTDEHAGMCKLIYNWWSLMSSRFL